MQSKAQGEKGHHQDHFYHSCYSKAPTIEPTHENSQPAEMIIYHQQGAENSAAAQKALKQGKKELSYMLIFCYRYLETVILLLDSQLFHYLQMED